MTHNAARRSQLCKGASLKPYQSSIIGKWVNLWYLLNEGGFHFEYRFLLQNVRFPYADNICLSCVCALNSMQKSHVDL